MSLACFCSCHTCAVRAERASIPVQCEQMVTDDVAQDAQINRAKGFWVLGLGP